MQSRSTGNPTKRQQRRFDAFRRIGCIACSLRGLFEDADVHHILSGGRRTSHDNTLPLCPWHHRGVMARDNAGGPRWHEEVYGPSLSRAPRRFRDVFGTEESLLEKVNELIARYLK